MHDHNTAIYVPTYLKEITIQGLVRRHHRTAMLTLLALVKQLNEDINGQNGDALMEDCQTRVV
eukprot:4217794-Pleurochrysis_carterae.AAC.3